MPGGWGKVGEKVGGSWQKSWRRRKPWIRSASLLRVRVKRGEEIVDLLGMAPGLQETGALRVERIGCR